jgi:predicted RNA-binding protein YlxR (DUF448 family)
MPAVKKIPTRRCTGCGEHFPKNALLRVVRSPEGEISLDATGRRPGRGAYLCRSAECLRRARKTRRLETSLEVTIDAAVYETMEKELSGAE